MPVSRHVLVLSGAPIRLTGVVLMCAVVALLSVSGIRAPGPTAVSTSAFTRTSDPSPTTRAAIVSSTTTVAARTAVAAPDVASLPADATPVSDLPVAALNAYERGAQVIDAVRPGCHLRWGTLAAIGQIESDHGRAGAGGSRIDGTSSYPVRGTVLDGARGTARVVDTDGGQLDGITAWDRAVGPMQFLPSTWINVRVDGDGDGVRSPDDLDDAALGAAVFLCAWGDDLASQSGALQAIGHFNHTRGYAAAALALARTYDSENYLSYAWADVLSSTWSDLSTLEATTPSTPSTLASAEGPGASSATPPAVSSPTQGAAVPTSSPATVPSAAADPTPSTDPTQSPTTPPDPAPATSSTPASSPSETPSETPSAAASESPTAAPTSTPTPAPTTDPTTDPTTVSGTLLACGLQEFCVGDQTLDFGALDTPAAADFDQDGTTGTKLAELTGLVGTDVTLTLRGAGSSAAVVTVNGITW
jgi:hypothetical protein